VFFFNLTWYASQKTSIYLEGDYTASRDFFDPFDLPDPEEAPANWDNDFSVISEYSNLKYKYLDTTVGGTWQFASKSSLYLSFTIMDLMDDQAYVYGDLTGTLLLTSLGMRVAF